VAAGIVPWHPELDGEGSRWLVAEWDHQYSLRLPLDAHVLHAHPLLQWVLLWIVAAYYLGGAGHSTSNRAFKSGPGVGSGQNVNFPNIQTDVTQTATSFSNKYFMVPDFSAALV